MNASPGGCWGVPTFTTIAAIVTGSLVHCGAAQTTTDVVTAAHTADEKAFGAEMLACVATAATLGESHDCRAGVRDFWCAPGKPLSLQGACGDSGLYLPALHDAGGQDGYFHE